MLKKKYIDSISASHAIFETIISNKNESTTWVVSDLTSKLSLQEKVFHVEKTIPDDTLMRAQELWGKIFSRTFFDFKVIPQEVALLFVQDFLKNHEHEWAQRKGAAAMALQYLNTFMPILTFQDGHEVMKDFFTKQIPSYVKWGHWYLLCHQLFDAFKKNKMVMNSWIPYYLLQSDDWDWTKPLVFDLGSQLLAVEAELILKLSKKQDCTVLIPNVDWISRYEKLLVGYQILGEDLSHKKNIFKYEYERQDFRKYSTQLSEVQESMSLIREWIQKENILPSQIALVSPDIGTYWPVLATYLKIEGIPVNKSETTVYKNIPAFQKWVSLLKLACGEKAFSDLETGFYLQEDFAFQNYDHFLSENYNFYDVSNIKNKHVKEVYSKAEIFNNQTTSLLGFVEWALSYWKDSQTELLQGVLNRLYQSFPVQLEFSFLNWISILEHTLTNMEVVVSESDPNGIRCLDLMSLKDVPVTHVLFLGLTDSAVRRSSSIQVQDSDVDFFKTQYGIFLQPIEKVDFEFEVLWNIQSLNRKSILMYSPMDFLSKEEAPSRVWFLGATEQYKSKIFEQKPGNHRLFQKQSHFTFSNSLESQFLKRDIGIEERKWKMEHEPTKISASQIEDFLNCPFINACKKIFKLVDLPDLDLDLDYLTRGVILHKVAEDILSDSEGLSYNDSQILEKLDQAYLASKERVKDPLFWKNQRSIYFKMIKNFIGFEQRLRNDFPYLKASYFEKSFSLWIHRNTGEVYLEDQMSSENNFSKNDYIELRGRIDRIDTDDKDEVAVAVDYKFDHSSYKNYGKWFQENQLQLLLYMYAIENGILEKKYRVIGSLYYGFKTATRAKGFLDKEVDGLLYKIGRQQNAGDQEKKNDLYKQLKKTLVTVVSDMTDGKYEPNPKDQKICKDCKWSLMCRAPHLN